MLLVTTSRNARKHERQLARQFSRKFGLVYFNRTARSLFDVVEKARFEGAGKVIIVAKEKNKNCFQVLNVSENGFSYESVFDSIQGIEGFAKKAIA